MLLEYLQSLLLFRDNCPGQQYVLYNNIGQYISIVVSVPIDIKTLHRGQNDKRHITDTCWLHFSLPLCEILVVLGAKCYKHEMK